MTRFLQNILAEPAELRGSLNYTLNGGTAALDQAADLARDARAIYITGIGSSWHAGMAVQSIFHQAGVPALLVDASELLHFVRLAPGACLIVLSRSGKSVEIVKLLDKAEAGGATVVGITNTPDSPLARRAMVVLPLKAAFDHNVSVTMYSALALVGGLLATQTVGGDVRAVGEALHHVLEAVGGRFEVWQSKIAASSWMERNLPTYFLARGASLASCHEARLLWEEAVKIPATAMTTGGFRHGPQEVVPGGVRIGLWLAPEILREADIRLAEDLRGSGAPVVLIGQNLPEQFVGLSLELPSLPRILSGWQFLFDIMPIQVASEHLARRLGADCDEFKLCPYIIEDEGGLTASSQEKQR